jgi:hypothetical protein
MIANRPGSQQRRNRVYWLVVRRRSTACNDVKRLGCKRVLTRLLERGAREPVPRLHLTVAPSIR